METNTSDGTYKHVDLLVSARCVVGICVHLFLRRFSFQHHVPNATILRTWSQFWENEFKWKSSSHLFQVRCNRQLLPRFVSLLLPKNQWLEDDVFFWGDGLAAIFRGYDVIFREGIYFSVLHIMTILLFAPHRLETQTQLPEKEIQVW